MSKQANLQPKQLPNRPLVTDFSDVTMRRAMTARRRAAAKVRVPFKPKGIYMKLIHKPVFAALAIMAVTGLSGTAYAAFNGGLSSITALFGGEQKTHDARIVTVAVRNCHDVNPFNVVSGTGSGNTNRYYLVKDSAGLDNGQVVSLAQSICRASYDLPADVQLARQIENRPENKGTLVGNGEGKIVGLTDSSVDIQVGGNLTSNGKPYVEHFTHIDPALAILNGSGTAQTLAALRVGDMVYSQFRPLPGNSYATETTALNDVDWSNQILVTVTKQNADQAAYDTYQRLTQAKALEQVVPCKQNPSGYCTYDQLKR